MTSLESATKIADWCVLPLRIPRQCRHLCLYTLMSHVQQPGQVTSQPVQQMCTQLVVSLMWHCHMDAVCPDTRYEEKLQEKRAQHKSQGLWSQCYDSAYNRRTIWVTVSHHIQCFSKDWYRSLEHGPASKVMSKLHEHHVLTLHKVLTSRRVLEREKTDQRERTDQNRQNRPIHIKCRILPFPFGQWPMVIARAAALGGSRYDS